MPAGLYDLKQACNESVENLLDRWGENPNWQYFCRFNTMQPAVSRIAREMETVNLG